MITHDKPFVLQTDASITQKSSDKKHRLDWVDNLRTLTILLVVNMHACVTYSHVGSWYFNAPPEPTIPQKIPFFVWQAHLQSFFMGLLFFIAGYYADRSLSRKSKSAFLMERIRRLGLPTLFFMLAIQPFIEIVLDPERNHSTVAGYYSWALSRGRFLGHTGPMWFAFALLIFSIVLSAIRRPAPSTEVEPFELQARHLLGLGLFIGLLTFLVRTVQPQGSSILNFQLCYFAQYVVVFGAGIYISQKDALNLLATSSLAVRTGLITIIVGPIAWLGVVLTSLPLPAQGHPSIDGGWNIHALLYAVWEQMTGVGLGIGVIAFCARKVNFRTRFTKWLSDRSFAVYLLHAPILIALSLWVQPYRKDPYTMSVLMTLAALVATFAAADLAKKIPLFNKIL